MAPEPVANCSTINPSAEHFRLSCKPGFDGGMEQFFEVTVRENNSGAVVYNTTTTTDLQLEKLDIKNLSAGMSYIATVSTIIMSHNSILVQHFVEKNENSGCFLELI